MRNIPVQDCGDGFTRADNGCFGKGPVAKTAAYTILSGQPGTIFSNAGASGEVVFTLPLPKAGMWFAFFKSVAAQNLVVKATSAAKINAGTAGQVYKNITSEVGTCTLFSDGVDWFVAAEKGTWANAAS